MRRRTGRRSLLLLASSSLAALMIGSGAPPALAGTCAIIPAVNQSSVSNSGSINCIDFSGITVTGNVTNTGTGVITGALGGGIPSRTGITIKNSSIGGTISNAGTITAGVLGLGILLQRNTISGDVVNSGSISAGDIGIVVGVTNFVGGISNSEIGRAHV